MKCIWEDVLYELRVGKVNGFLRKGFKRKSLDVILTYQKKTPFSIYPLFIRKKP